MNKNDEIIKEIIATLNTAISDLIKEGHCSSPKWTKRIKTDLVKLGKKNNCSPCAHSVGTTTDWGEWLYDVCWLEYHDIDNYQVVKKMILAVESEWGTTDKKIFEDFQKLLVCNAEFKLLIFQDKSELTEILIKTIKKFEYGNGFFILAYLNNKTNKFEYKIVPEKMN